MQNGLSTCESSSATPPPSLDSEALQSPKQGYREPQVEQGASEAGGSCEDMAVDKEGRDDVRRDVGEEEEEGLEEMDSDGYEYVYEDSEEEGEGQEEGGKPEGSRSRSAGRKAQHVVFSGLDRIGCTKDMLLKKELTRLKADVELGKRGWNVDLTWAEATRMLGVRLEHEGFVKAELELTFPAAYPQEPPLFHYKGPRFDDAVDFVLGADTLEPCRKENWNDTFSCSSLLTLVMELVKDKYPITESLVFDEWESTLVQLCRSRLPGVPQRVKEGMIYFGVRLVPGSGGDTGTLKPTAGVGYSDSSRASAFHDFSVPDARFKKHVETFARFLQLAKTATSVMLQRIQHVEMSAWLWQ
ncbi:Ubiquitin-conjugating enzyme/RWD [Nannochloropsis gaditana]|uniref:Ubiquitin-conjugating enzyme/RWD n=1 Tax=Nannochloropsis gaditana TaxID=72520 RepID=W7TZR3_9STRA|nr:Ubiquitin-conjugating enzyme/RWD [Nannochloropsis gaditana]